MVLDGLGCDVSPENVPVDLVLKESVVSSSGMIVLASMLILMKSTEVVSLTLPRIRLDREQQVLDAFEFNSWFEVGVEHSFPWLVGVYIIPL